MRQYSLTSLIICLSIMFAFPAHADVYFGADYSYTSMKHAIDPHPDFNDNYHMLGPVIGAEINGFGIEGFYKFSDDTKNIFGKKSKLNSYGTDFILAIPTNEAIDFITSAGYVHHELSYKTDDRQKVQINAKGPRFGLGLQINFNNHIALRTMYHYTSLTSHSDDFDYINELSTGLRIGF